MTEDQQPIQPAEPIPSPLIPWGWLRAIIYFIIYIMLTVGLGIVAYLFFGIGGGEDYIARMAEPSMILFGALQIAALIGVTALMRLYIDRQSFVSLGFSLKSRYVKDLGAGLLWGIGMISAVFLILWALGGIKVTEVQFPWATLLLMIPALLFAAAQEEIVIRGYLLNNLMQSANKYLSLILTSLVFSLGHIFNPNLSAAALVNIVLAGLVLGIYYVHRKNLWFPIGLHLAWNYFQGVIYGSPVSGITTPGVMTLEFNPSYDTLTGGTFGFEAGWLTTVLLIVVTIALHLKYRPKPVSAGQSAPPVD